MGQAGWVYGGDGDELMGRALLCSSSLSLSTLPPLLATSSASLEESLCFSSPLAAEEEELAPSGSECEDTLALIEKWCDALLL